MASSGLLIGLIACLAGTGFAHATTLGVSTDGQYFTIDGKPAFLLGISYYSGASVGDPRAMRRDLDDIKAAGFNWIRVWATWNGCGLDVSAVAGDGSNKFSEDGKPYRSFRMDEHRMIEQLDDVEKEVLRRAAREIAN